MANPSSKPGFNAHVIGMAVDEHYVYATHYYSKIDSPHDSPEPGVLIVMNRATFAEITRIPVGYQPRKVAVNPQTKRVYVTNYGQKSYSLSVIDSMMFREIAQLKLGQVPIDVEVNPTTNRIYVTNPYQRKIHVIDGVTNRELPAIDVGPGSVGIAVNKGSNTIYAALSHRSSQPNVNALIVIDGATHKIVHTVPINPILLQSRDVTVNPPTNRIYVANLGANDPLAKPSITVIDPTYNIVATIPTISGVSAVTINPSLNHVYAATAGAMQVIDGATNKIISTIGRLGKSLQCIVADTNMGRLYLGDGLEGEIHRIMLTQKS